MTERVLNGLRDLLHRRSFARECCFYDESGPLF